MGIYRMVLRCAAPMIAACAAVPLGAVTLQESLDHLHRPARAFVEPSLDVKPSLTTSAQNDAAVTARVAAFERRVGGRWEVRWDSRGDRPNLVQGSGVALIPGRGNRLAPSRFGVAAAQEMDLATVTREARRFLDAQKDLLKLDGIQLRPDPKRSGSYGKDKGFWTIEFAQVVGNVPVDGAFVYARVSQGNVVQFGAERVGEVRIDALPKSTREEAFRAAWSELGFPAGTVVQTWGERGELRIYPSAPPQELAATAFAGTRGEGYRHVLAWRYVFRVDGNDASWQVLVDATSNRVLDVRDLNLNADATVSGGVYPTTNLEAEVVMPFPFATVTVDAATTITDTLGIYDYTGGTASTSLDGKYFKMVDNCGAILLSSSTDGNLAFGTGPGTDCATPDGNTAGPGNTHASRTGFYHLTRINEKARGILPDNTWLQGKVTANMNVDDVCNAGYSPLNGTVNFYKSGTHPSDPSIHCGNTGEIAAVFLHEWGHGLDNNEGGAASENGSGEAVGDTFAFLETKESCIGPGFYASGQTCSGCTTCTGVRDLNDFSQTGTRTIASPPNVEASDGINCRGGQLTCPWLVGGFIPYQGPMGYEGHCESYIAGSANWDLKNALAERFGTDEGYAAMDGIWYGSLLPSKSAYQVQDGGQCNPKATVNGCAATNWYTVYLAVDDDDGDLDNGTPNACRIWDAFNAHGIACGERPVCTVDAPDFSLRVTDSPQAICAATDASFNVEVRSTLGFSNAVTLAASGQPGGTSASFSTNPVVPGNATTLTIGGTGASAAGDYTIDIAGTAQDSPGHGTHAELTVFTAAPGAPTLTSPADGADSVNSSDATLTWQASDQAASYTIEVATDAAFTQIVASQSGLTTTSWHASGLSPTTRYYWRVRATNVCGGGSDSAVFSFTTSATLCRNPAASIGAELSDVITVAQKQTVDGVRVRVDQTSGLILSGVGISLSHGGQSVTVFQNDQCNASSMNVVFDDAASAPVDCPLLAPASGTYLPLNPLGAAFAGQAAAGDWTLTITDGLGAFLPGTLNTWCLDLDLGAAGDDIFADGFDGDAP
ncbi:fibronectin type III domain-containing protein [Dokdonella sp.]|uniref:fibronectin type III domain-containing protein n=1 Tax=Dokdonella sp. TaxID=2291710 RepID=UPI001AFCDBBE|nr:fibronectin type III domain-containing protein [Dokdonella sp.]MBO9663078.1 fibronectin type III domain-containing protein [Dokdonella sp.]